MRIYVLLLKKGFDLAFSECPSSRLIKRAIAFHIVLIKGACAGRFVMVSENSLFFVHFNNLLLL